MSPVKRAACMLAAGAAIGLCAAPSIAKADPVVDAAVAQLNDLGIGTLTGMPSGRTTYRTYDEIQAELTALATTYPDMVVVKTAPYKSIAGPRHQVRRDHQQPDGEGRQARLLQHGRDPRQRDPGAPRTASSSPTTCSSWRRRTPKVKALFDKVRLVDMPVVNADGHVLNRRASCGGAIVAARDVLDDAGRHRHEPQLSVRLGLQHRRLASPRAAPARARSPRSRTRWRSCRTSRS